MSKEQDYNIEKPYAPACERNQQAIYNVLENIIDQEDSNVLEIGSGTGQHSVYMAKRFNHIQWHTSDLVSYHQGIEMWINESKLQNISKPIWYESGKTDFPKIATDIVFSANTFHIMSWTNVKILIRQMGEYLKPGAKIILYGPFNRGGNYSSDSNAEFDKWLFQQDKNSAIRNFEDIVKHMNNNSIQLINEYDMPANNQILYFKHN